MPRVRETPLHRNTSVSSLEEKAIRLREISLYVVHQITRTIYTQSEEEEEENEPNVRQEEYDRITRMPTHGLWSSLRTRHVGW